MAPLLIRLLFLAAAASACLFDWELEGRPAPEGVRMRRQDTDLTPIGEGNRWENEIPRGVGTQPADTVVTHIMNPGEIRAAVDALAEEFDLDVFDLPEETHEGAVMFGGRLGARCPRTLLTAGIHGRERGGPDNLVYFIADLLWAQREETGLVYGGRHFSHDDVGKALGTGILFVPLQNPDGVAHDQANGDCWRRNRNPEAPVDLNRNFDYVWDVQTKFAPEVAERAASEDPTKEMYHGTKAFSEPETRNIKWVLDENLSISWAMDIHSPAAVVGYSWGEDYNQYMDPDMNMLNDEYDSKRGLQRDPEDSQYNAYRDCDAWKADAFVAGRVANAMIGSAGNPYISVVQAISLYATSGDLSDYISARHVMDPSKPAAHGLTMEFGADAAGACATYHGVADFNDNIRQAGAGLMEFLIAAADEGDNGVGCAEDSGSESDNDSDSDDE